MSVTRDEILATMADKAIIEDSIAEFRFKMAEEMASLERIMEKTGHEIEDQLVLAHAHGNKRPRSLYPLKLNRRHYLVMQWFLDNPKGLQRECAKALGYSAAWISKIVNSRPYRAKMREMLKLKYSSSANMSLIKSFAELNK